MSASPIQQSTHGNLGCYNAKLSRTAQPASVHASATRIPPHRILQGKKRVLGFKHLNRRVSAIPVHGAHHRIAVMRYRGTPTAAFEVIIRVVLTCFGVNTTKKKIAGSGPFGGSCPLWHGLA